MTPEPVTMPPINKCNGARVEMSQTILKCDNFAASLIFMFLHSAEFVKRSTISRLIVSNIDLVH